MKNIKESLKNPPSEFSLVPFWFWSDELIKEKITEQIEQMHLKEIDGFVIHPRMGIPEEMEYMSEEYLDCVRHAVSEAARLNMKVVLYDEAMYPSGSAHGMVPATNPEFASKGIKVTESENAVFSPSGGQEVVCSLAAVKTGENSVDFGSVYEITDGELKEGYTAFHFVQDFAGGHIRGIHIGEDDWENPPAASDLLNPDAVKCFINLTHDKYYNALSEFFGNTVIGIFTDEPSVMGREPDENMLPWTYGFIELFLNEGLNKKDLLALWYDAGENTASIRKTYDELVGKRLDDTFYKQIYSWCEKHNISLVGHPAHSQDIGRLKYFHIPGQDLIFRRVAPEENKGICGEESTQAKCSADSARHRNRQRNLNECFACSGKNGNEWDFTFDDMKWMTDWLIVRGVNMLVPHAFFYSMDGEKRFGERPPDVGMNNIWWENYGRYARYVKRLCYLMTDSVNTAEIAVLCESDRLPHLIVKELFENQIEFNYLEKELLPCCRLEDGKIKIVNQEYKYLLIDKAELIDEKIIEIAKSGVKVVVYNPEGVALGDEITSICDNYEMLNIFEKTVDVTPIQKNLRVSRVKKEGEYFYLLVNEGEEDICGKISFVCGENFEVFNPWTGEFCTGNTFRLGRRESMIICAGDKLTEKAVISLECDEIAEETVIRDWYIDGKKTKLGSWTEEESTKDFFGTMKYDAEFDFLPEKGKKIILDLGDVCDKAEVTVNGSGHMEKLWAPFEFDVTSLLKEGKNTISVFVSNGIGNKYSLKRTPSGLLGEVKIKIVG